jgi:hypothetical protein
MPQEKTYESILFFERYQRILLQNAFIALQLELMGH